MKTIYVDTSVFGGQFDPEFQLWTKLFFKQVLKGELLLLYSEVAEDELKGSPKQVRDFVKSIPAKNIKKVSLTTEAIIWLKNIYKRR